MRKTILGAATATVLATAALAAPGAAEAATSRVNYVHSTGVCQPATPLELGGLRFRPLGIFNNKTTAIYISCTLDTELVGTYNLTDISIYFDNQGNVGRTVECTAVGGRRGVATSSVAGDAVLSANSGGTIYFNDVDRVSSSYTAYGISCLLPPKVEMGMIRMMEVDAGDGL
ncbi:hypothetical protein [Lysobacter sp. A3-1-A15]|uniref:hypothetical protein n=1 Tax=Novilysobacter viscosus TaxID=3098602 RepID=UPI002ED96179